MKIQYGYLKDQCDLDLILNNLKTIFSQNIYTGVQIKVDFILR
jgi:hypothetical protein